MKITVERDNRMKNAINMMESGLIEQYVFGLASDAEISEVERMSEQHPEIRAAIDELSIYLEQSAFANAVAPPAEIKPMVMATVDYLSRMENGELPSFPPMLSAKSRISDFEEWLQKPDFTSPDDMTDLYAKIISYTPKVLTAIVWIKEMAPSEVHNDEHEQFLIVEGACDIIVEDQVYSLVAGDYFQIPLFKNHKVLVTSSIACKAILQRVAA